MKKYFKGKSIYESDQDPIKRISERFIADNPMTPYSYRAFNTSGFIRDKIGRCILDFDSKFPNAQDGEYAYAFSKFYSDTDGICCLSISCRNPNEVFVNGKSVTKTTYFDEVLYEERKFDFHVQKGYNTIFIKNKKNALGFQCTIGCYSPKWLPVNFYTAFSDNSGELGWNFCGPYKEDAVSIPEIDSPQASGWMPAPEKNTSYSYGNTAYAVTFLECLSDNEVRISFQSAPGFRLYSDGKFIFESVGDGTEEVRFSKGTHRISVEMSKLIPNTEFTVSGGRFFLPSFIKGVRGCWLYLETDDISARNGFDEFTLYKSRNRKTYFKCGKNSFIRPVLERPVYGKSNYPIGVALYGLLASGMYEGNHEVCQYVHNHIMQCCLIQNYAQWDCEIFGSACVNHQLLHLSSLDDCGSFASAMLEDYLNYSHDERILPVASYIGDYILYKQERLDNGTFYRKMPGEFFQYTVWADDLYMSTPFLIRYAAVKNDPAILNDAVQQFINFKKLLFMPDKKLMSHVYNLKFEKQTKVPWGRGNGWVLFSLSELLAVLPKEHEHYGEIVMFFTELCEGFLSATDTDGMCHQVLDDWESYAEASCTAMCSAAFARGVSYGILDEKYAEAAKKSAEALLKYCVDSDGNIYGVCVGSGYSFTREYYKYDLPWNVNDTHGTGIVLIALTELKKLSQK